MKNCDAHQGLHCPPTLRRERGSESDGVKERKMKRTRERERRERERMREKK